MEAIVTGISGGTGEKLTKATIIVAGTMSLVASLISIVYVLICMDCASVTNLVYRSIWLQSYVFVRFEFNLDTYSVQKELSKATASKICDQDFAHVRMPLFAWTKY